MTYETLQVTNASGYVYKQFPGVKHMNEKLIEINRMLVEIYDDVNHIEEYSIKKGAFSDLSITEIHTIEAVGLYHPRTMSEIAAELGITLGTLTIAVDKLIRKGYLERSRSDTDRRIVYITLTKRGKLAYRIHEKFHMDMVRAIMMDFTSQEEEVLLTALRKLNQHLKDIYS
jgi:DNA-binding MarR family transcriptional regulator